MHIPSLYCRCKVAKEAPYAVFKSSLPYNTSDTISKVTSGDNFDTNKPTSEGQRVTEEPITNAYRRSPNGEQRCRSRDPPRGDTFHHRRTKGKACKGHSAVVPSQMPAASRSQSTTVSMKMTLLKASRSRALTTNKKRVGKAKSTRKSLLVYPTRGQDPPRARNPYGQTSSTTKNTQCSTQMPSRQLNLPTLITAVNKTTRVQKEACCSTRMPLTDERDKQEATSYMATVTPVTTRNALPVKVTTLQTLRHKKTIETPKRNTLRNITTFSTPISRKQKTVASPHKNAKLQKQMDSCLPQYNISQGPMGDISAQSTHEERSQKRNNSLRTTTGECCSCC